MTRDIQNEFGCEQKWLGLLYVCFNVPYHIPILFSDAVGVVSPESYGTALRMNQQSVFWCRTVLCGRFGIQAVRSGETWLASLESIQVWMRLNVFVLAHLSFFPLFCCCCWNWWRGFNPFRRSHDDSSDLSAKCQQEDGDAGCVAKVTRTKSNGRKRGVPPAASKLEVVPISRIKSGEGQGSVARSVEHAPCLD